MARFQVIGMDAVETINTLKVYRSGLANEIREGWGCGVPGAKDFLYELYEISGTIILAIENRLSGSGVDKMAMHMTHDKLLKFVDSERFIEFSVLGDCGAVGVVRSGTKYYIMLMFECLDVLMA